MATKYFGTDGIRLHAEEFTYDFLNAVIAGLISYRGNTDFSLLIGGDTRESTAVILQNLSDIATAQGIEVSSVRVFPTPAINYFTASSGFDFAIDVTASHNPATYNGLKIFELKDSESTKLCEAGRATVEQALQSITSTTAYPSLPMHDLHGQAIEAYLAHLRDYLGACDFSGLKLGMDCANGATSVIATKLFKEFGADVELINADQNYGTSINYLCGSTHLEQLENLVKTKKLDFGVAFDGDGDRCLLVDHLGNTVDGDKILAVLADYLGLRTFVTTVMANQGLFSWAAEHGMTIEITDVGDQNVFARMQEKHLMLGGEQSGHIILPYEPMGDGMLTALMLTKVVSELKTPLATIAASIPTFPQFMLNVPATREQKAKLDTEPVQAIIKKYDDFLSAKQGRLLVRPSGTEDLIRLTMWGTEDLNIEALTNELAKELQEVL